MLTFANSFKVRISGLFTTISGEISEKFWVLPCVYRCLSLLAIAISGRQSQIAFAQIDLTQAVLNTPVKKAKILNFSVLRLSCLHLRIIVFFVSVHKNVQYPFGLIMTLEGS